MNEFLRWFLPAYYLFSLFILVLVKSLSAMKKTGANPIFLSSDDSAHGLVSTYFKIAGILLTIFVFVYSCFPSAHKYFVPIAYLENYYLQLGGIFLMTISLILMSYSQHGMRQSWRIGVDSGTKTELITDGIFAISRNPIYLGLLGSFAGVFFAVPNALTLAFLTTAYVIVQVQIRLEEEYLTRMHGATYLSYKQKVRRML